MGACCVRQASGEYSFSFFIHTVFITLKSKLGLSEFLEFNMY